ncbi:MAG: hypothetical protein COA49_02665 [Bacteroidetes bacterium]|nr:MAG: hypothetical protein COA49_02665 [Bacteroidota bacterium]
MYSVIVNNLLEGGSISQLDSIEKAIVESIAWLCPFTEGNAVYRARGIMNYINSEHVQYTNECEIQTQNHVSPGEKSNRKESEEIKMILFPNPASDFIYVELSDKSEVDEIKLFSSTGKELVVNNQLKTKKGIRISLAGLSPGVYFIRSGALSEKLTITSN